MQAPSETTSSKINTGLPSSAGFSSLHTRRDTMSSFGTQNKLMGVLGTNIKGLNALSKKSVLSRQAIRNVKR